MQFQNTHTHVFTMNNAPEEFLQLYLPKVVANAIDTATNTKAGAATLEWLLSKLAGNGGKRYASFLKIGKSASQKDVFENLIQQYDDSGMQFVALTMYMEKCGAGNSISGFEGQIEEILTVKKQYPDKLKIFLGIDPRWKATGADLKQTVEAYFDTKLAITPTKSIYPFSGLKLYPSTGFYVFDEKLKETFEWAAQKKVPIVSHCNYLGGIYTNDDDYLKNNLNPYVSYDVDKLYSAYCNSVGNTTPIYQQKKNILKWIFGTNEANNNKLTCSYFLDPASYEPVLNYFDSKGTPLKLCLAHFGGDEQIKIKIKKRQK